MTKQFKTIKKEDTRITHFTVLWCEADKEETKRKEKRLAELALTAALRKRKREKSFVSKKDSTHGTESPFYRLDLNP